VDQFSIIMNTFDKVNINKETKMMLTTQTNQSN